MKKGMCVISAVLLFFWGIVAGIWIFNNYLNGLSLENLLEQKKRVKYLDKKDSCEDDGLPF